MNDQTTTVAELMSLVDAFILERDWMKFHDAKNLSASIAIEAAELMEHFQWLRTDELEAVKTDSKVMGQVREEIADVLAYVLSFARRMEIDLSVALADKMRKNARKYPAEEYRGRYRQ